MSSKKISKSVGVDSETMEFLKKKALEENRSFSGLVGKILRDYFERAGEKGVVKNAN